MPTMPGSSIQLELIFGHQPLCSQLLRYRLAMAEVCVPALPPEDLSLIHRLHSRTGVRIYLILPIMAPHLPPQKQKSSRYLQGPMWFMTPLPDSATNLSRILLLVLSLSLSAPLLLPTLLQPQMASLLLLEHSRRYPLGTLSSLFLDCHPSKKNCTTYLLSLSSLHIKFILERPSLTPHLPPTTHLFPNSTNHFFPWSVSPSYVTNMYLFICLWLVSPM